MGMIKSTLEDWVVPVDYFGKWTPARQTFARHTEAFFVEVSKEQFFAVTGPLDFVTSAKGDSETGFSSFATRYGHEIGRVYSCSEGVIQTRRLLTRELAEQQRGVLSVH